MFNCEGEGELMYIQVLKSDRISAPKWIMAIVEDPEDFSQNRYLQADGKRFLNTPISDPAWDQKLYFARDSCELKRVYNQRFRKGYRTLWK